MILYGALQSNYNVLFYWDGIPFTILGAVERRKAPEVVQATSFPIYGALLHTKKAPKFFKTPYGVKHSLIAPNLFRTNYALLNQFKVTLTFNKTFALKHITSPGAKIYGLNVSDIKYNLTFNTPALSYDIAPYYAGDVLTVLGTNIPYSISLTTLTFESVPTGPITVVPHRRLQIYSDEVKELTIVNTIPTRAEFFDIQVNGGFQFSLDGQNWNNTLNVVDKFFIKAPNLAQDGVDLNQALTITAKVFPKG